MCKRRKRWWRSKWTWSTSLSTDIRNAPSDTEVHAEHQLRVHRSTWPVQKNIQNHAKLGRMKELGEKTGVFVGLDLPSAGGGTEAGVRSPIWKIVWVRGETFKAESETDDLWQPKSNENQTVLATAIYTPDRNAGHLEGTAAGSGSLGIVEQSQGESCHWLREMDWGGVGEEIMERNTCGGKWGTHGSKVILLSHM